MARVMKISKNNIQKRGDNNTNYRLLTPTREGYNAPLNEACCLI